jgi:hypothetical protein
MTQLTTPKDTVWWGNDLDQIIAEAVEYLHDMNADKRPHAHKQTSTTMRERP